MTTSVTAYTLAQLSSDLTTLLGDLNSTRFSATMLYDAINYAIKQLVTRKGYTYIEATITRTVPTSGSFTGLSTYPLTSCMDYIVIKKVMMGSYSSTTWPLKALLDSSVAYEDTKNPEWRITTGFPVRWVLADGKTIMTSPAINMSLADVPTPFTLTVGYVQQPALLSSTSDTVDGRIPYTIHQYLKYLAASWLLSLDNTDTQNLAVSKQYADTFWGLVGD